MTRLNTAKTLTIATVLLVLAVLAFWLAASPPAGDQSDYSVARESHPFGLYSPGIVDDMPAGATQLLLEGLGFPTVTDFQDYTLGLVEDLGITWVRLDFPFDGNQFIVPEDYLARLHSNGVEIVGSPRALGPPNEEGLAGFEANLGELVAAHPEIAVWQIDSEPGLGGTDSSAYVETFFSARRAISDNCPSCRIALAGVPVRDPSPQEALAYYDSVLEEIAVRHKDEEPPFDIFDIHFYGPAGESGALLSSLNDYQDLLRQHDLDAGVSFWMSECATYAGVPDFPIGLPAQSEQQQAGELVARFVTMLGAGGERVAWARPYERHESTGVAGGYNDFSGLVYNGIGAEAVLGIPAGTRKAAFESYRVLVGELDGYVGVSQVAPGQYRFEFSDGRMPVYVVWAVDETALTDELTGAIQVTRLDGSVYNSLALEPGETPVFVKKR